MVTEVMINSNKPGKSARRKIYEFVRDAVVSIPLVRRYRASRKVKIRPESELKTRFEGLCRAADALNDIGIVWHISGGTALGVARDGDFIKWDWDVGFGLKYEDVNLREDEIINSMKRAGLRVRRMLYEELREVMEFDYKGHKMELLLWHDGGEYRIRKTQKRPARFFDDIEYRDLRGREFPFPSPLEEYLEFLYGDWKTPKRTAVKREYRSDQAYTNMR